jgi:hypothetical protein
MNGDQIASLLASKKGQAREDAIVELVKQGHYVVRWAPIVVYEGGKKFTFYVTAEPLMLGETWDDGFYVGTSASTLQRIADALNATMLTPKLVDEIWNQAAFRVDPIVSWTVLQQAGLPKKATMEDIETMVLHTREVKKRIAGPRSSTGSKPPLMSNIGKYWVVNSQTTKRTKIASMPKLEAAVNYGWHRRAKGTSNKTATKQPDTDLYQQAGTRHSLIYPDYSQLVMLVARDVKVCEPTAVAGLGASSVYKCADGKPCSIKSEAGRTRCIDIYDLAQDPVYAKAVSHEGVINMRIPSVAWDKPDVCPMLTLAAPESDENAIAGLGSPYAVVAPRSGLGSTTCGKPPPAPPTDIVGTYRKYAFWGAIGVGSAAALYLLLTRPSN